MHTCRFARVARLRMLCGAIGHCVRYLVLSFCLNDNLIDLSLSRCFVIRDDKIVMTGSLNCGEVAVN